MPKQGGVISFMDEQCMGLNEIAMPTQYFVHASWAARFVLVFLEVA
jgi:hypothetical protein